MQDDSIVFLACARQESRDIDEGYDWDIEGIAEADEACTLPTGIHVEDTCIRHGLVGNDTYALAVEMRKARDDVLGKLRLYLEEFPVIRDRGDHLIHVIGLVRIIGQDLVQQVILAVDRVVAFHAGSLFRIVRGKVAQQFLDHCHRLFLGLGGKAGHAALAGVDAGTS